MEDCVIFWNVKNGDKQAKSVKNLLCISSCADFCLLAAIMDDDPKQVRGRSANVYLLL